MSARDVLVKALMDRDDEDVDWIDADSAQKYAEAAIRAIRGMSVEDLADLLGGGSEIETVPLFTTSVGSGEVLRRWSRSRVVGPWQEKP